MSKHGISDVAASMIAVFVAWQAVQTAGQEQPEQTVGRDKSVGFDRSLVVKMTA